MVWNDGVGGRAWDDRDGRPSGARPGRGSTGPHAPGSGSLGARDYLYHEGKIVNTYPVAVGEPEYPTPKGDFSISRIEWNPDWVPPNTEWGNKREKTDPNDPDNPMVGAKLFFEYPDYYIHGTDATHTLGQAESHGCIRMDPDEVKDLAKWVQEHAGAERSESWYAEARQDETMHVVKLPNAIPVEIRE